MKICNPPISCRYLPLSFLVLFAKCSVERNKTKNFSQGHPNIIFILADDLGYGDLSCYGQSKFSTPHIDDLANNGMRFTQHYAGSTVSAPSRACLLTGMHTGHSFIRGNKSAEPEGQYPLASEQVTIVEMLKQAGYVTGVFGKWGLGPPGSEGDPNYQGFDEFYGFNCQSLAHNYYPYHLWHNQVKDILEENKGTQNGIYAPERIHAKALDFIEKNKDTNFFLYYATTIPHAELVAPENYMKLFRDKFLPEKKYMGVDSGPKYKQGGYMSQNESHAAFVAMIYLLDKQVGEIVNKLKELGIKDNTLIIFTSDNGPHLEGGADPEYFDSNGKLKGFKRDLYEGGIRVPMIACWPGKIEKGSVSDHISAFWDFFPTFCEMSGIRLPAKIDGISILPELLGKKQEEHQYLYWEFHELNGRQAVRMGIWKGVRMNMGDNPYAPIELYNISIDIGENNNVASQHPDIVREMGNIMKKEHRKSDVFPYRYETEEKKD